ncbi:hypothetical protein OPQ81_010044 [Rhizoctonia solani]|nr:hypothetical protein OPQ81_010044 [Rhizoctonia solani]
MFSDPASLVRYTDSLTSSPKAKVRLDASFSHPLTQMVITHLLYFTYAYGSLATTSVARCILVGSPRKLWPSTVLILDPIHELLAHVLGSCIKYALHSYLLLRYIPNAIHLGSYQLKSPTLCGDGGINYYASLSLLLR